MKTEKGLSEETPLVVLYDFIIKEELDEVDDKTDLVEHLNNDEEVIFKRSLIKEESQTEDVKYVNHKHNLEEDYTKKQRDKEVQIPFDAVKITSDCGNCDVIFDQKDKLEEHKKNQSDKGDKNLFNKNKHTFSCDMCNTTFHYKEHLEEHKRMHPEKESMNLYSCNLCNKNFKLKSSLTRHFRKVHDKKIVNVEKRAFSCNLCERSFSIKNSLRRHMRKDHKVPRVKATDNNSKPCEICKNVINHGNWSRHMKRHALKAQKMMLGTLKCPRGPCRYCGKECTLKNRARHEKYCKNKDPLEISPKKLKVINQEKTSTMSLTICDLCFKSFYEKSALEWHKYSEHGIKT